MIGAAVQDQGKPDPAVRFHGPDETRLGWNDNHDFTSSLLPQESPLPAVNSNDPEALVHYAVSSPGPYFLEVGGSGDDFGVRFGVDNYGDPRFKPAGGTPTRNDTLNTIAFGLSTGTRDANWEFSRNGCRPVYNSMR